LPADSPRSLESVHLRHLHIHQDNAIGTQFERPKHLETIGRDIGAIPEASKQLHRYLLVYCVVLSQKDPAGGRQLRS
jgi:hypothetical protein